MSNYQLLKSTELFRKNESIYIHQSTSLPNFVGIMHTHDFIEINYIISGEADHVENGISCSARKGDLFIVNYGVPHMNVKSENNEEPFIAYDIAFTPDFLDEYMKKETDFLKLKSSFLFNSIFLEQPQNQPDLKLTGKGMYEFEQLIKNMLTEFASQKKGYYDLLRAYLIELLIKIFRRLDDAGNLEAKTKQDYYINLATQYIENNYQKNINLKDITNRSFLSKSYFSQLFKDTTGVCFSDYLQKTRVSNACILLTTTDLTINQISKEVGFNDLKFFYTVFKKFMEVTPKQYRESNK